MTVRTVVWVFMALAIAALAADTPSPTMAPPVANRSTITVNRMNTTECPNDHTSSKCYGSAGSNGTAGSNGAHHRNSGNSTRTCPNGGCTGRVPETTTDEPAPMYCCANQRTPPPSTEPPETAERSTTTNRATAAPSARRKSSTDQKKDDTKVYDVIIVGMGAAGCAAASELCKWGKSVLALEAQDRVGGRVHTEPFGTGVIELGAEWIHGEKLSSLYELAMRNNVKIVPQDIRFQVFRSDGSLADSEMLNDLISFALSAVDDPPCAPEPLGEHLTKRLLNYIEENYPHLANDRDFLIQFLNFMDLVIDNYESSDSWHDVTTHSRYEDLGGNLHLSWHKNGYNTVFDILLNTYNDGSGFDSLDLQLKKPVSLINYTHDSMRNIEVCCDDGTVYVGRSIIITVSLGVLKERHQTLFTPPLPIKKVKSINDISIGVVGKIILNFDHIWWDPKAPSFVFIWKGEDRAKVPYEDRWILKIEGAEVPMGSNTSLVFWTSGNATKMVEMLPDDEVLIKVMRLLRQFMGRNRAVPEPVDMIRSFWWSNPYTRGSYTYDNLLTPLNPDARALLAEPILDNSGNPRVLFAGEATDEVHFSTVHGAIDSGVREARRLLPSLLPSKL